MKYLITLVATISFLPLFSQSEKDENTVIQYEYTKSEDPNAEYPRIEIDEGDWVIPVVEMQGILVGYAKSHDYEAYFDLSASNSWDVWLYVENNTGKDIVYNNSQDWVASIKFPGQETYFESSTVGKDMSRTGGRCPFMAYMLDEVNGKFVMKAGERYNWAYTVYRDVDNIALEAVQKYFRPLFVETLVPTQYSINRPPNLLAYKEGTNPGKISKDVELGKNRHRLELPKEYIFLSPYFPTFESKSNFPKEGVYEIIYDNGSYKIGFRVLDNWGKIEYKITNTSPRKLVQKSIPYFGYMYLNEFAKVPLYLNKSQFQTNYLNQGESVTHVVDAPIPHPSGQAYIKKGKFERRSLKTTSIAVTKLVLEKLDGEQESGESIGGNEALINIIAPNDGKNNSTAIYLKDGNQLEVKRGTPYQIKVSNPGLFKWMALDTYYPKYPYKKEKIDKFFGPKPGIMKFTINSLEVEIGKQYYFTCHASDESNSTCESITKTQWETELKNAGVGLGFKPIVLNP